MSVPLYIVLIGVRPLGLGRTFTHMVEARDPEHAATRVVEMRGGDPSKLQEADPVDGMPTFHHGGHALVVERLTPNPQEPQP